VRLHWCEVELRQRDTWRVADHGFDAVPALVVAVEHDGKVGIGEAPAFRVTRHNSELPTMRAALEGLRPWLATTEPGPPGQLWPALRAQLTEHPFVLHAVDVALWDLWGKLQDRTVRALLGTDGPVRAVTAYSIGLDEPRTMPRKMHERPDWPIYKIKVAGPEHLDTLALLRSETNAPSHVDGNCSWQPKNILAALGPMAEFSVTLLEQPLPIPLWDEMRDVRKEAAFLVIADESVTSAGDVSRCRDGFDGVNIKLPKLGGLSPAMDAARAARAGAGHHGRLHAGIHGRHLGHRSTSRLSRPLGHGQRTAAPGRPGHGRRDRRRRPRPIVPRTGNGRAPASGGAGASRAGLRGVGGRDGPVGCWWGSGRLQGEAPRERLPGGACLFCRSGPRLRLACPAGHARGDRCMPLRCLAATCWLWWRGGLVGRVWWAPMDAGGWWVAG
jgi:L-alanine-DL-glutamate epimerase-like enolase superfamily enzyme